MKTKFLSIILAGATMVACSPEDVVEGAPNNQYQGLSISGMRSTTQVEGQLWQHTEDLEDELISLSRYLVAQGLRNYEWTASDVAKVRVLAGNSISECADLLDVIQAVPGLETHINTAITSSTDLSNLVTIDQGNPIGSLNAYLVRNQIQYFLGIVVPNNMEIGSKVSSEPLISAGLQADSDLDESAEENILVSENSQEYYYIDEDEAKNEISRPLFVVGIDTDANSDFSNPGITFTGSADEIDPYSVIPPFDGTAEHKVQSRTTYHIDQFKPHNRFERRSDSEVRIKWAWKTDNQGAANSSDNWTIWNKERDTDKNDINDYIGWTYLFDKNSYLSDYNFGYNAFERDWWETGFRIFWMPNVVDVDEYVFTEDPNIPGSVTTTITTSSRFIVTGHRTYFDDVYFFDAHYNTVYPILSNHTFQWATHTYSHKGASHRIWRIDM